MAQNKVKQNSSGIVGLFNVEQAAQTIYYAMHAIQHRGQDGVGVAVSDGNSVVCKKGLGLLAETLKQDVIDELPGNAAIGQLRMATSHDSQLENVQPIMVRSHQRYFAVVSNGMITNSISLRNKLEDEGLIFQGTSDSELLAHLIQINPGSFVEKIQKACQMMSGAYAFMIITKDSLYVARDPHGIRPLSIAKVDDGYCVSSETCSFPILGGEFLREVEPGELIQLSDEGLTSYRISEVNDKKSCALEYVYYSRPDSVHNGLTVHEVRKQCGYYLAKAEDVEADIVVGVPDSALSAAASFAHTLNVPYETGLIKNRYIGSTFIRPTQQQRLQGMRVRLNAISSVVKGKRVYLVDDSVVKGFTSKRISQLLREAGAKEVHLRIASPELKYPCLYGADSTSKKDLAAANYSLKDMEQLFNVDSIRFLSVEDFKKCVPETSCLACCTGEYPEELKDYKDEVEV
jgi:amidophosphoribosyltransferase